MGSRGQSQFQICLSSEQTEAEQARSETPKRHGFKPDSPVETTLPISLLFLASNSVTFSGIDSGFGNGGSPSVH